MTPRHADDHDLVSIAEAGRRIGLRNLRQHKKVYGDFPDPDPRTGGKLYKMGAVRRWYSRAVQNPTDKETT